MDLFERAVIELWQCLNTHGLRYIVVGDFAATFHGYHRFAGVIHPWIEETPANRKKFRQAYADYGMGDYESIETIEFVPGLIDFPLLNGMKLDIQTKLKGVDFSFGECLEIAPIITIEGVDIPFLHLNHLMANKKAVGRSKDLNDTIELEKIIKLQRDSEV